MVPFNASDYLRQRTLRQRMAELQQRGEQIAREEWNSTWAVCRKELTAETLLSLGTLLRQRSCGYWLDVIECQIHQREFVADLQRRPHAGDSLAFRVVTLQLLKTALIPAEGLLKKTLTTIRNTGTREFITSAMVSYQEDIQSWMSVEFPEMPLLRRSDLAAACKAAHLKGYYPTARITERLDNHQMFIHQEIGPMPDGRSYYGQFQHGDLEQHRLLLRLVVQWLRSKIGPVGSFSELPWTTDLSENEG
jgi:hypothetical protein